jgi:hypothetical protein
VDRKLVFIILAIFALCSPVFADQLYDSTYRVDPNDPIGTSDFWNPRFLSLDDRLDFLEDNSGATVTPGGSDGAVQYDSGNAFTGEAAFDYDPATNTLTIDGSIIANSYFKLKEGGASPTYFSILQGGDQAADLTYTLPTAYPSASGQVWSSTNAGVMSWVTKPSVETVGTPADIAGAAVLGTDTEAARSDHVHRGVSSFTETGGTLRYGAISITEGSGVTITDNADGTFTIAASGASESTGTVYVDVDLLSQASGVTWTNMPFDETELFGAVLGRTRLNLTGAVQYRIVCMQTVAGASAADLNLEYSDDDATWNNADTAAAGECAVGTGTGMKQGDWTDLVAGAKTAVQIRLVGKQGNTIADPAFSRIAVQFSYVVGGISLSTIDAKGDLLVGTANDTVSRLAVGTNDYVLTADSAEATGTKWAASGGGADLAADESISGNWVNTTNPWADNEVADTITVGASGSVNDAAIPSGITRDTEWDTQGEVETVWGATLATDTELAAHADDGIHSIMFNVKDYGAVGDGSTDDTAAAQAAIDAAEATSGTGRKQVFFPDGAYNVTTGVTVDADDISLVGVPGHTWLQTASQTANILTLGNGGAIRYRNTVRDIFFKHTAATATAGSALYANLIGFSEIRNVYVYGGTTKPWDAVTLNQVQQSRIEDVTITSMANDGMVVTGSPINEALDLRITNLYTASNARYGYRQGANTQGVFIESGNAYGNGDVGFLLLGTASDDTDNNILSDCITDSNGNDGLYVEYADRTIIDNLWAGANTTEGVTIGANATNVTMTGGYIVQSTTIGLNVAGDHANVMGTYFEDNSNGADNTYSDIYVTSDGSYVNVTGCAFNDVTANDSEYNIDLGGVVGDHVRLSGNQFFGAQTASVSDWELVENGLKGASFTLLSLNALVTADSDVPLFPVGHGFDKGMIIEQIAVTLNTSAQQIDCNLIYVDSALTLANPVTIDVVDTTSGLFFEDTDANINGGAAIPFGKQVMLDFDATPNAAITFMHVDLRVREAD